MNMTVIKVKCLRCNYEWFPRNELKPKVCPKCKSYFWDKIKREKKVKFVDPK